MKKSDIDKVYPRPISILNRDVHDQARGVPSHPVPDVLPLFSLREQRRTKTRLNDPQTAANSKNTPKVKQGDKVKSSDVLSSDVGDRQHPQSNLNNIYVTQQRLID